MLARLSNYLTVFAYSMVIMLSGVESYLNEPSLMKALGRSATVAGLFLVALPLLHFWLYFFHNPGSPFQRWRLGRAGKEARTETSGV